MQGLSTNQLVLGNSIISNSGQNLYANGQMVAAPVFTKGTMFFHPTGIGNGVYNFPLWRAPFNCQITGIHGMRVGGGGATINVRKNFTNSHLISDLSLTTTGAWISSGIIQNNTYVAGDILEGRVLSTTTSPNSISIQVDFITN